MDSFGAFWREQVAADPPGVWIRFDDGQGGVRLNNSGEYAWYLEIRGREISPVETMEPVGPFVKTRNLLRVRKFGALPPVTRFGRIAEPSARAACSFREDKPDDPASIMKRRHLPIGGLANLVGIPNGFPIAKDGQYLLLRAEVGPEGLVGYPHRPQVLTPGFVAGLLGAARAAGRNWAVGYNPWGGGASVDHEHGHAVRVKFPVEDAPRITVGDFFYPFGWPAGCLGIETADAATLWDAIDRLQRRSIPVNLLIRGETVFIYGRRPDAELTSEFPSNVMAFFELSGVLAISDEQVFHALTAELVATAMRRTTVSVEGLLSALA
jgi:hypothetical protein